MRDFPLPNDVIRDIHEDSPGHRRMLAKVVASVMYRDEPTEIATVLLLYDAPPYFAVAHYYLEATPADEGLVWKEGELNVLGNHENIVPAVRQYEETGGDY